MTRAADRGTDEYAALRASPDLVLGVALIGQTESTAYLGSQQRGGKTIHTFESTLELHRNGSGLRRAREAVAILERTWPGLDWHDASADEPVPDLTPNGIGARLAGSSAGCSRRTDHRRGVRRLARERDRQRLDDRGDPHRVSRWGRRR